MSKTLHIARKEIAGFFASPVAFLFLAGFLLINLFIFFWVERFFSRNIADVRPLFQWMPLLLVFLVSALTMRMWSEERRSGTIETLLTLPVDSLKLVLGKFLACLTLVAIALLLTLPVPITVSFLGEIDWGPVVGGYLASIFLAASYIAIGLFISSANDNQIVSLILTSAVCLILFLLGSEALVPLLGNRGVEILQLIGSGSRFESITRGVLDIRDIYYYSSLVGVFLALNVLVLERLRWMVRSKTRDLGQRRWILFTVLVSFNLLLANFWIHELRALRIDLTKNKIYSISETTSNYLEQLQEPLLIRGYFSDRTHPLLAPLVPQLRDLIREYEVTAGGRVRAEFIDPRENPEIEEEANRKYGIRPVPFQISDRYEASLVNSYFDLLIQYGDQFEVLSFQDLIEVKMEGESDLQVMLRNPEYDVTRSIRKVVYGFQSVESLFESLATPVTFQGFISDSSRLPAELSEYKNQLSTALEELSTASGDMFKFQLVDPQANGGAIAKQIEEQYGFRPMATSLFADDPFYFYSVLQGPDQMEMVSLPEDLSKEGAKRSIEAALKRFSQGFLKTVGMVTPPAPPSNPLMQQMMSGGRQFQILEEQLGQNFQIEKIDLASGVVPSQIDLLLVLSPEELSEKQVFALDQFLMQGGTIVLATSPFGINRTQNELKAEPLDSGLKDWLSHLGITIEDSLVLDPQNENYPVPVTRNLGGFNVQEVRMVPYPFFPDIRSDGMSSDSLILSGIPQITLNWSSPLEVVIPEDSDRTYTPLLRSSSEAWTSTSTNILPDFQSFPGLGFASGTPQQITVAGILEGNFSSYFAKRESPLLKNRDETEPEGEVEESEQAEPAFSGTINRSPESARVIVVSSNEFLNDQTLQISASTGSNRFVNSLQFIENALDWSLEDQGLLAIRSRGHFSRTLKPMDKSEHMLWEYLNYGMALLGLLLILLIYRRRNISAENRYQRILNKVEG